MKYAELTKLKQCKSLNRKVAWAFDCETKDGLKGCELFCWSLATKKGHKNKDLIVHSGKSMKSFFQTLQKLSTDKMQIIYIHNQNFDARFLIDYCIRNDILYKDIYANSNMILLFLPELHFKFVDSFQYLLESQENAEITFNVDENLRKIDCKQIFEKDFKLWSDKDKQQVIDHNKNDVRALHEIMRKFREKLFEISNVDLLQTNTLASLALKAFRKTMKENIVNAYLNVKYDKKEKKFYYILNEDKYYFAKKCYFGGRTECLNHNVVENVNYNDTISMFPAQMKNKLFPSGLPEWETDSKKIWASLTDKLSIIEAKMIPNYSENIPILPFRKENKTIFGNFNEIGIWTSIEIEYALERGYMFEFYRALIFPEKFNPFEDFIDRFYKMKSENKGAIKKIAKIILNGSYGKFGQRVDQMHSNFIFFNTENEALTFYQSKIDNNEKAKMDYNQIYNKWLVKYYEESRLLKPFQMVHLSAFITAYARLELTKKIHLLTDNGVNVYYCDTDSIVSQPSKYLQLGSNLGDWDIECSFSEFKALAPKCYIARYSNDEHNNEKVRGKLLLKVKGIRRDKINEILTNNNNIEAIHQEIKNDIILSEQYLPIKSSIIRNDSALSSCITTKKLSLIDSKRVTNEDNTTFPLSDNI